MNSLLNKRAFSSIKHVINNTKSISAINIKNKIQITNRRFCSQKSVYLVDETKCDNHLSTLSNLNKYTTRTATCGELTKNNLGQRVILTGWLEFNRMDKFLVLRDSYGQTQLLLKDNAHELRNKVKNISYESILQVKGTVIARPQEMINKKQETGEIEIDVEDLNVLNEAEILPFNIREYQKANEALQMQYRYLSLRFSDMQRNLRFRSEFCINLREFLARKCGFVEVETPTLFKATPGGAQEFVVPTRHKNRFYSLVQSPQQFKQMLMCGGIDRYFQIARCYRDETSRPDRQPEFTQLDIEMANTTVDGVVELIEDLLQYSWPSNLFPIPPKFPRMSYKDALANYGSDKPDIRFDHTIINISDILSCLNSYGQGDEFYAGCLVFDKTRHSIKLGKDFIKNSAKDYPNTRVTIFKCENFEEFSKNLGKITKTDETITTMYKKLKLNGISSIVLVYGNKTNALKRLGKLRETCAESLKSQNIDIYKPGMHFLWIVDFPLFSQDENGHLSAEHHPFTSPRLDDVHLLDEDPLKVRALAYDLVLNGYEVGGGSIRVHDAKLQAKMLKMLNISGLDHIVEMLSYGCPPHGGVALGLDRLFAKILDTPSIRDVIAFPKTFDGKDSLSGAPSIISDECKKIYHL